MKKERGLHPFLYPIENLFAVGECPASTLFGDCHVGSFSLCLYTAAGKNAAETAVAEINAD